EGLLDQRHPGHDGLARRQHRRPPAHGPGAEASLVRPRAGLRRAGRRPGDEGRAHRQARGEEEGGRPVTVLEEAVEEAERRLENIGPRPEFEPTFVGPIWRTEDGAWLMPEHTIGWDVIGWCAEYLRGAGGDDGWIFTPEQARMVLWWYAVNPTDLDEDDSEDIWRYRDGVIQKVKGWGKDPFAAVICAVELCGPSRPVAWRHPDGTESPKYVEGAEIVAGRLKSEPWVQVFGTSVDQTKNTMSYLQGIFTK